MAIAYVGERIRSNVTDSGPITDTLPIASDTTAGNTLLLIVGLGGDRRITSITDTQGNVWRQDNATSNGNGVNLWSCSLVTALTTSDSLTLTYTSSGALNREWLALEFSGIVSGVGAVYTDKKAWRITFSPGGTSLDVGPTAATSQPDELVVAAFVANSAHTFTGTAGYTSITALTGGTRCLFVEYKIVAAIGQQESMPTMNSVSGQNIWHGVLVTYKAPLAVPAPPVVRKSTAVRSGLVVTAQGTPALAVDVSAGVIGVDDSLVAVAAGSLTVQEAFADPRWDVACVTPAGALVMITSTTSDPVSPLYPDWEGNVPLAAVYVAGGATTIQTADIVDLRPLTDLGLVLTLVNTAPASGDMVAGELAVWLDATPGATQLMAKAKDSGGTVRSGSLALT